MDESLGGCPCFHPRTDAGASGDKAADLQPFIAARTVMRLTPKRSQSVFSGGNNDPGR
jgi:hypothetical protein